VVKWSAQSGGFAKCPDRRAVRQYILGEISPAETNAIKGGINCGRLQRTFETGEQNEAGKPGRL
jgi:hypothetical protein